LFIGVWVLFPHEVKKSEMLNSEKRALRAKAEQKKKMAHKKFLSGDLRGALDDLKEARLYIQKALRLVRSLGERGSAERTIQDDIENLWRRILNNNPSRV